MSEKTHWRKLQNPEYLGSWDLDGDTVVKIINVITKEVTGIKGTTKETILILENSKPMIVNVTNQLMIQGIYNEFVEDWKGKLIKLYPTKTKVRGNMMDCIRIRNVVPTTTVKTEVKKPPIAEEKLTAAITSIKDGNFTIEKLIAKFDLTVEQKTKLDAEFKD